MKSKFKIKGLDCANCASQLEKSIQKLDGIESANISFMTDDALETLYRNSEKVAEYLRHLFEFTENGIDSPGKTIYN